MKIKPINTVMVASHIFGIIMLKDKEYEVELSRPLSEDNDRFYFIHPIYNSECIGYKYQFEMILL